MAFSAGTVTGPAQPALVTWLTRQTDLSNGIRLASVLFVATLTAVGAQITMPLPLTPIPLTVQDMIVLLGGAVLGARLGATAQVIYLLAGFLGLPVFAASPDLPGGFARVLGPTGGYLLTFPLAAAVTGALAERGFDRRYRLQVLALASGLVVLLLGGALRLAYGPSLLGLGPALRVGFLPFAAIGLVKIAAAATLLPFLWRHVGPVMPWTQPATALGFLQLDGNYYKAACRPRSPGGPCELSLTSSCHAPTIKLFESEPAARFHWAVTEQRLRDQGWWSADDPNL